MGGFRTVLLFEFNWCLINVIFVAELLVYLLCTSYVLELHALLNEYLLIEKKKKNASINTYNPAKKMNKVISEPRMRQIPDCCL